MAGAPSLESLRNDEFPDPGSGTYLDTAGFGLLPRSTVQVVSSLAEARARAGGFEEEDLGATLGRARQAAASLIGADAEEITLAPNTSYGVNLAVRLAAGGPPGTIVLSDGEFPANVLPWMALESEGFRVERVPADPLGRPDEERLLERLGDDDVRAFALSAVQFGSGHRADLDAFGARCRQGGVLFCVDAIQALGAVPVDVRAARVDVLASGGQKWLCSPWGSGFAYIRRELRDRFDPPMVSWLSMEGATDLEAPAEYRYAFVSDGRKFELATLGIQDHAGMARSIETLLSAGPARIHRHVLRVLRPLERWVADADGAVPVTPSDPKRRAGIYSFRVPALRRIAAALDDAGFHVAIRDGAIRVAPHLYNTEDEVERLVDVLDSAHERATVSRGP